MLCSKTVFRIVYVCVCVCEVGGVWTGLHHILLLLKLISESIFLFAETFPLCWSV